MSGLRKAKNYDWKDSNLALFGSDIEKNVKKAAAQTEEAWKGAGEKPGLKIWRIVKFEVTDWPKEDYGKFFSGDSYIILNTYKDKESDELLYDVHFWIGKESSQDEYGTAAYKTVELDTFLNDKPVQHREVMKQESSLFKSYFEDVVIMSGGAETGFRRVGPKEYQPRLLKFNDEGRNKVKMTECTYCKESVTPDNVYIIDNGLTIFQVNGSQSDKDERMKAAQFVMKLKFDMHDCNNHWNPLGRFVVHYLSNEWLFRCRICMPLQIPLWLCWNDDFNKTAKLPSGDPSQDLEEPGDDDFTKTIFKLSDESGHLTFTDMGTFSKDVLSSDDVFVCDNGKTCLVYVGKKASIEERRKGMEYAHNYLLKTKHPLIPVTVMQEGQKSEVFDTLF